MSTKWTFVRVAYHVPAGKDSFSFGRKNLLSFFHRTIYAAPAAGGACRKIRQPFIDFPASDNQPGSNLRQGQKDESSFVKIRMRQAKLRHCTLESFGNEQIDVDRARPPMFFAHAAERTLDALSATQEHEGRKARIQSGAGVKKRRLLLIPPRRCLIKRGYAQKTRILDMT